LLLVAATGPIGNTETMALHVKRYSGRPIKALESGGYRRLRKMLRQVGEVASLRPIGHTVLGY